MDPTDHLDNDISNKGIEGMDGKTLDRHVIVSNCEFEMEVFSKECTCGEHYVGR